ncbi:anti-sigma factor family protein [Anaerosporobacter sp.]|uniref:anti-sigma factor family protein n=1 Tax=Anaerosporobacter sp. TaxID=1872529 RepID=UPI00286F4488|nr:zf-HC2 domain-containing protein [Anaerosporobacter sp.]
MTCKEAQALIMPYINDQLDVDQLEEFLKHIEHCSDCKEELEVYFTLLTGMKQLDEDKNLSGDLHIDFEKSLHKSEERIRRVRLNYVRKRMIYIIVCCVFCILVNVNSSSIIETDIEEEKVEESNFFLEYYYFLDKQTLLNKEIEHHYEDIMEYIIRCQTREAIDFEERIDKPMNDIDIKEEYNR